MFNISLSLSPTKTRFGPLLFSGDLEMGMKNASTLGYNAVELSLLDSRKLDQLWLLDRLKSLNLHVYAISTGQTYYNDGYSLYDIEENKRKKAIDRIKAHIDLASKLDSMIVIGGIRGVIIDEDGSKKLKQKDEGKLALNECATYATKKKVILLIEPINRYETNFINTLEEGIELINDIGSDNLKILPDTFHMNIEEKSIEDSLMKARSYIGYMHFADSNRLAPGWGHTNFKNIISFLIKVNYKGAIGIEILPKPDDYKAAKQAINYLKKLQI